MVSPTMTQWPIAAPGGSWTLPRATAATQGSQTRSWSQCSQGRRAEALGCRSPNGQVLQKMPGPERESPGPRPQTSRRAPSFTHLQAAGVAQAPQATENKPPYLQAAAVPQAQSNGSTKVPPSGGMQQEVQDEAQMNNLRHSLLQHIQSVQREIARLQYERRRTQQGLSDSKGQSSAPEQAQLASSAPKVLPVGASPMLVPTNSAPQGTTSASAMVTPLTQLSSQTGRLQQPPICSPQSSTRGFSCERSTSDRSSSDRWRQIPGPARREAQPAGSLQGSLQAPVAPVSQAASATIPMLSGGSVVISSSLQTPLRAMSPSRLDGPVRAASPLHGKSPAARSLPRATKQDISPTRTSLGVTRSPQSVMRSSRVDTHVAAAALHIQRSWRRHVKKTRRRSRREPKRRKFLAVHLAATRIQRAWKLHLWRRKFVDYSQRENGWVGSLEWLQKHNLLYGTELADAEDVKWWLQQRATAPLDREVDPWGSERLLEHLNRMWYGGRAVEIMQQQQKQRQREQQELEQRTEDIFSAFAAFPQESSSQAHETGTWTNAKSVLRAPAAAAGVASSLRALPSAERSPGGRQVSVASQKEGLRTGASLSPRLEAASGPPWITNGGTPTAPLGPDSLAARLKGAVLGAPPPSMHGYQRSYRVASHSPPQTHRAARATVPATPTLGLSSLRPRSPVQSISGTTPSSSRLSLPSSSSMQTRSLGTVQGAVPVQRHSSSMNRALSGSPPPSVVGRSPLATRR